MPGESGLSEAAIPTFLEWCFDNQINTDDGENLPEAFGWYAEAVNLSEEDFKELIS